MGTEITEIELKYFVERGYPNDCFIDGLLSDGREGRSTGWLKRRAGRRPEPHQSRHLHPDHRRGCAPPRDAALRDGGAVMATFAHSDEAAAVLDLLGRVSLRLWMLASEAEQAGHPARAKVLHDLSDECDAACVTLTPFVADEDPNNTFRGDDFAGFAENH